MANKTISKAEVLKNLREYSIEALKVLKLLKEIKSLLEKYNINTDYEWDWTKVIGAKLGWGDASANTGLPPGDADVGAHVYLVKSKIEVVRKTYYSKFPDQLVYLNPEKLQSFKCLPTSGALNNPDIYDAVKRSIKEMNTKLDGIDEKIMELNNLSDTDTADASIWQKALSAFTSVGYANVLNSFTTEEKIVQDFKEKRITQNNEQKNGYVTMVNGVAEGNSRYSSYEKYLQSELSGSSSTPVGLNTVVLGLTPVPALGTKWLSDFNMWWASRQAPKSMDICSNTKSPIDATSLKAALKDKNLVVNGQVQKSAAAEDSSPILGAEIVNSQDFTMLSARFHLALQKNTSLTEKERGMYEDQFKALEQRVKTSTTREMVRNAIRSISDLTKQVSG
jgi:hypothetical protein